MARRAPGIAPASTPKRLPGGLLHHVSDTARYAQQIQIRPGRQQPGSQAGSYTGGQ